MKYDRVVATIIVIITVVGAIGFYFFIASGAFIMFYSKPPKPTVEYGEFAFKLIYETNGEEKVVEDTIICEYDGFDINAARVSRKWKTSFKSGNERITLEDMSTTMSLDSQGRPILEFFLPCRGAAYYMGDSKQTYTEDEPFDELGYVYGKFNGTTGISYMKVEEVEEKFGIRLISWEEERPIKNSFEG